MPRLLRNYLVWAIVLCLTLSGCGYKLGSGDIIRPYSTISIPYIQGDVSGDFTAALVRQVTVTTPLRYTDCGGDLLLQATLICPTEENIGFRYDIENGSRKAHSKKVAADNVDASVKPFSRKQGSRKEGRLKQNVGTRKHASSKFSEDVRCRAPWLIPTEERMWISAEITLVDNCSGECLIGPVIVSVFIEFDHEYYLSRNGVNVFSLGQVTDIREATDAAQTPLSEALAKKIVDTISYAW